MAAVAATAADRRGYSCGENRNLPAYPYLSEETLSEISGVKQ